MADWDSLQKEIGINFKDLSLLQQAFVHRSYLNENPEFTLPSNERLEFLGDAVLSLMIAEELYRQFPYLDEGEMTELRAALVHKGSLARLASSLHLGDYLYLGKGEEKGGGRRKPRNLACVLEALIGAIFIDQGFSPAREFTLKLFEEGLKQAVERGLPVDYKSKLQEVVQAGGRGIPRYRLAEAVGPNHDKRFTVEAVVGGEVLGRGSGKSKQSAEKEAARKALERLSEGRKF